MDSIQVDSITPQEFLISPIATDNHHGQTMLVSKRLSSWCSGYFFFTNEMQTLPWKDEVSTPNGKGTMVLIYDIARPDEAEEVFEFMLEHFFSRTPVRQIHLIDQDEETRRPLWKLHHLRKCFSQPYSIVVREENRSGRLVASLANYLEEKGTWKRMEVDPNDRSPGWLARGLIAELNKDLDLFDLYKTDLVFNLCMTTVAKEYSKQHIATKMAMLTIKIAYYRGGAGAIKAEFFNGAQRVQSRTFAPIMNIRTVDYATFRLNDGSCPLMNVDLGPENKCARLAYSKLSLEIVSKY